jgi:hypothetical protein
MLAIKKATASEITLERVEALKDYWLREAYLAQYETISGEQNYLKAYQNYGDLKGQQSNLYKCFLPQAWKFTNNQGFSAFLHPGSVYDDPGGGPLRRKLYQRLRHKFAFTNENKLFAEVDNHTKFLIYFYGLSREGTPLYI